MFYVKNEGTMRTGFINILSKYKDQTINDIKSLPDLLGYIQYLGSEDFKKEIEKNFKFIGLVSIRSLRTVKKNCETKGISKGKVCYQEKYGTNTKYSTPVLFTFPEAVQDYFYYYTKEQNRQFSVSKGLFSTYDGSGYILAFDHTDPTYIEERNLRFAALANDYFQDNTKAVIVNYNLYYPVLNVNFTSEIVSYDHEAL